jgi:hypothetical protein
LMVKIYFEFQVNSFDSIPIFDFIKKL